MAQLPSVVGPRGPRGAGPARLGRLLLAAAILGIAAPAAAACRMAPLARVPMQVVSNRPLVQLELDGRPANFLIDTGADRTVFSIDAVRDLGLARDPWVSTSIRGVGGVTETTANATLRTFRLGGIPLVRRGLAQPLSFVVAPLSLDPPGPPAAGGRTVGILGADYLSVFDLDLDFPAGQLTLTRTEGCAREPLPWGQANQAVKLERPTLTAILAPVGIGGQTLRAQLDTGSTLSLITVKGAARLGITPDMLSQDQVSGARGIGRQTLALRRRNVSSLRLGPVEYRDVPMAFGAPAGGFPFDMLLGMDLLRSQHVFISYATGQLLVAHR